MIGTNNKVDNEKRKWERKTNMIPRSESESESGWLMSCCSIVVVVLMFEWLEVVEACNLIYNPANRIQCAKGVPVVSVHR